MSLTGRDGTQTLSLDPVPCRIRSWASYYSRKLHSGKYGVIALFYSTTFSSVKLRDIYCCPHRTGNDVSGVARLVGDNSGEPGLPALTRGLENDGEQYRIAAEGHYNTSKFQEPMTTVSMRSGRGTRRPWMPSCRPLRRSAGSADGDTALPVLQARRDAQARGFSVHPLTAICAVQAVLSLSLVWSNAALKTRRTISGSVTGMASLAAWGIVAISLCRSFPFRAAHRPTRLSAPLPTASGVSPERESLSLGFMLAATVLLYLTASRLIGRRGAL